ncbi:MAG: hypothetical protein KF760_10855 [Candidatus Eremiobacteraeota bacterium]|nr:hypothetical protein [Candidatus Eremiobacteraeota bacterium]MCW5867231.1 hypothetical protein [Candidatus Eremiobacteraeota bacterium]
MRILLWLFCLTSALPAQPVASFQGATERKTTERFQVEGPWKLVWRFQGTALKVFIHTDLSAPSAKPISQAGSGDGSLSIEQGGTFWLDIKSIGNYQISVENQSSSALPVFEGNLERKGTSVFSAPAGWGFKYSGQGVLKATLFDEQRNPVGTPAVLLGGGSGTQMIHKAGRYFFMIQSTGPYRIEIIQP